MGIAKFRFPRPSIFEIFITRVYEKIDVKGRTVIDVEAFVGDSTIYFALRGAKKVVAIEPHPGAYQEMIENIRMNNLMEKIIPVNAGLASKPGAVAVEDVDVDATARKYHGPGRGAIRAVTLEQVVRDYGVEPDVLKMDCEGCEYDVVINDYEHVRRFKEIILEHHGDPAPLLNMLRRDFDCYLLTGNIVHCTRRY